MSQPQQGRPHSTDTRERTAKFLCLVAAGMPADQAAKQAKLGPWRALRIISESSYADLLAAIRDSTEIAA